MIHNGFEILADDISIVLGRLGLDDSNENSERILDELTDDDFDRIAGAALDADLSEFENDDYDGHLNAQTDEAHTEIEVILRERGFI